MIRASSRAAAARAAVFWPTRHHRCRQSSSERRTPEMRYQCARRAAANRVGGRLRRRTSTRVEQFACGRVEPAHASSCEFHRQVSNSGEPIQSLGRTLDPVDVNTVAVKITLRCHFKALSKTSRIQSRTWCVGFVDSVFDVADDLSVSRARGRASRFGPTQSWKPQCIDSPLICEIR